MLDYIKGVAQAALTGDKGTKLSVWIDGSSIVVDLVSEDGERQQANSSQLHKATTYERGVAVGQNLVAAMEAQLATLPKAPDVLP